jgi:Amt family ammonium transporter
VWGGGWLAQMAALDFAGGTVVHVNAGVAALVAAIVVGKRQDTPRLMLPHSVPFVLLGAGLCGLAGSDSMQAARWRRTNGQPRVRDTPSCAGRDARRLDVPRRDAIGKADAVGCGDGDCGRPRGDHARGGFISPMSAIALGAIAAVPSYIG